MDKKSSLSYLHFEKVLFSNLTPVSFKSYFRQACQVQNPTGTPNYFNIGLQNTATFSTSAQGQITLQYVDNTPDGRQTVVNLNCDPTQEGTLTAQGEVTPKVYTLTYTGKYACPTAKPPPPTPPSGGISVGSILCIVFFSALIVYVIAGVLIQKFVRKASGKELIPQYSIWSATPAIIKDGVMFTVKCGKVGKGYDNI